MNDTVNSQAQQMKGTWSKAMDEGMARMAAALEETAKLEARTFEQATSTIDELAKLQKDSLVYLAKLGAEWRKLTLEATKRTADLFAARS